MSAHISLARRRLPPLAGPVRLRLWRQDRRTCRPSGRTSARGGSSAAPACCKSAALQNYLTQLASQGTANGTAPEQGGQYQTITGKIAAIGWDITGGQKYWYLTLADEPGHIYVGTVASVGPALVLAQPGDPVTISILNIGAQESTQTIQSFTDAHVPLHAPGSLRGRRPSRASR